MMRALTPSEIVAELDQYIIGQHAAKRALALALRSRWRRLQLDPALRHEVLPKNILLIGPASVGKTGLARRLATVANAPFVKVEASRFSQGGCAGHALEASIRELVDSAVNMFREQASARYRKIAEEHAEERLLDALLPKRRGPGMAIEINSEGDTESRGRLRRQLRAGELDHQDIEIDIAHASANDLLTTHDRDDVSAQLRLWLHSMAGGKAQKRHLTVANALPLLVEEAAARFINEHDIRQQAIAACEQHGIVFIDAIDQLCQANDDAASAAGREGVQRTLLSLLEGSTVSSPYGAIRTEHVLFIASGNFTQHTPAALIPELQGFFPLQVELSPLAQDDFQRILTEPRNALIRQYQALLAVDGVSVEFSETAIERIAEIACLLNDRRGNIGARRLHALLEIVLEGVSFEAPNRQPMSLVIDREWVDRQLGALLADIVAPRAVR